MTESDYKRLLEKLPHRGAMLLIDSIGRVTKDSVETGTMITPNRINLFGDGSTIGSYLGVELIAQSAALPLIYRSKNDKDHKGVIVQVRSFRSNSIPLDGVEGLTTRCDVELMMDEKVASVKGEVLSDGQVLCEGVITLAMQ